MANVNVWGPQTWSVLHGLSGLCSPSLLANKMKSTLLLSDYAALAKIFSLLRILLPCNLCLNSYRDFYNLMDAERSIIREIEDGGAHAFCYRLHNLVNEKLFMQRKGDVYLGQNIDSRRAKDLDESFRRVQNTPTLLVVEKRFKASDMRPFSEEAVWTTLAAFCVHIDKEKTDSAKRERVNAIRDFCGTIGPLLLLGHQYEELNSRVQSLEALLLALSPLDTEKSLDLLCFAKHEKLSSMSRRDRIKIKIGENASTPTLAQLSQPASTASTASALTSARASLIREIYQAEPKEVAERQFSKTSYLEALTVKSCELSCQ